MRIWPDNSGNIDPKDIMKALYYEKLDVEDVKKFLLVIMVHRLLFENMVKKYVLKILWLLVDDVKRCNQFTKGTLIYLRTWVDLKNVISQTLLDNIL